MFSKNNSWTPNDNKRKQFNLCGALESRAQKDLICSSESKIEKLTNKLQNLQLGKKYNLPPQKIQPPSLPQKYNLPPPKK